MQKRGFQFPASKYICKTSQISAKTFDHGKDILRVPFFPSATYSLTLLSNLVMSNKK